MQASAKPLAAETGESDSRRTWCEGVAYRRSASFAIFLEINGERGKLGIHGPATGRERE